MCQYYVLYIYTFILQADREDTPTEIGTRRTKVLAVQQVQEIASQPTESSKARKRTEFGMKEGDNPLLTLSLDAFQ